MPKEKRLQEHFHAVDLEHADVAELADLVRVAEFHAAIKL